MENHDIRFTLTNSSSSTVMLHVEPWAEQFSMSPEKTFTIRGTSEQLGLLEIEMKDGNLVVYGWSGSIFSVFDGDEQIM